ncbi:MAG: hypothetical protein ACLFR1_01505 [Spirochaetia bacterium]
MISKGKILLVEDEALIGMREHMELESYGYSVRHVFSGEEAVKAALSENADSDLILMDITHHKDLLIGAEYLKKNDTWRIT